LSVRGAYVPLLRAAVAADERSNAFTAVSFFLAAAATEASCSLRATESSKSWCMRMRALSGPSVGAKLHFLRAPSSPVPWGMCKCR
jgi:hypothetical protein